MKRTLRHIWEWGARVAPYATITLAVGETFGLYLVHTTTWPIIAALWAIHAIFDDREMRTYRSTHHASTHFVGKIALLMDHEYMVHTEPDGTRHIISARIERPEHDDEP